MIWLLLSPIFLLNSLFLLHQPAPPYPTAFLNLAVGAGLLSLWIAEKNPSGN